jgi:hypothetical protein
MQLKMGVYIGVQMQRGIGRSYCLCGFQRDLRAVVLKNSKGQQQLFASDPFFVFFFEQF